MLTPDPRPLAPDFDVLLYGAAGFTGRQTVAYFAKHAPPGLRWAIAGRSRERLEIARAEAGPGAEHVEIVFADSSDPASVDAAVARTRVLLTTAGPYSRYGSPVVDACVRHRVHYCDITGETPWIRAMIDRHHARAAAEGTKIVTCCGFDSVPSDIGSFLLARALGSAGTGCREVRGYFRMAGGFNGGTIASMATVYGSPTPYHLGDPFLLAPDAEHSREDRNRSRDPQAPFFDEHVGSWVGPFLMAIVNTRVVRRSAALWRERGQPYGRDFVYNEYQRYGPPLAAAKAILGTAALGVADKALRTSAGRALATRLLEPGAGPSERAMDRGWFRLDLVAEGEDGRIMRGVVKHSGDPGNRATVRFLCESALALATEAEALPPGGGVLTPATALGDVLVRRLRAAGVAIESGAG